MFALMNGGIALKFTSRQDQIISIVKKLEPISSDQIATYVGVTRATLRPDLTILTMSGVLDAKPRVGYFYNERSENALKAIPLCSLKVEDVKSIPIVINEADSVYDAIVSIFVNSVNALIVVSNQAKLEGIVSKADLLKSVLGRPDLNKIPVSVVMTKMPNVITIDREESVLAAAQKMIEHEVDCLPVVKEDRLDTGEIFLRVIGKISKTNITRILVEIGQGK